MSLWASALVDNLPYHDSSSFHTEHAMAKFSPLQLFTPIQLFFCIILFFLPWVEVQCVFPKEALKDAPKEQMDKMKQEVGWDPNTPFGFLEQSGFQIAIGDASPGSDMRRVMAKMEKELGSKGVNTTPTKTTTPTKNNNKFEFGTDASGKKKDRSTAPLLFVYPVLLIAGIVVGFIPWGSIVRRLILLLICLGALGTVGVQIAIGFPVEQEIKQEMKNEQGLGMGAFGLGNNPGKGGQPNIKIEDIIRVKWQIPLYLTLGLLGTASATSLLGPFGRGGGRRRPKYRKRKRPRDEYDDEDEENDRDDDDERPRKKKRIVDEEDEDEDDRPRKKRRDDDDDEDDRPKKKNRVVAEDDEDEEDRPRKKKSVVAEVDEDEDDEPPPPPKTAPKVVVKPSPAAPKPQPSPKPSAQAPKPSGTAPNPASKPAAPAPKPATGGSASGAPAPRRPFGQRPAAPPPPPPAFEVVEDDEDDPPPKKRKD